jgi:hypothetical protein
MTAVPLLPAARSLTPTGHGETVRLIRAARRFECEERRASSRRADGYHAARLAHRACDPSRTRRPPRAIPSARRALHRRASGRSRTRRSPSQSQPRRTPRTDRSLAACRFSLHARVHEAGARFQRRRHPVAIGVLPLDRVTLGRQPSRLASSCEVSESFSYHLSTRGRARTSLTARRDGEKPWHQLCLYRPSCDFS